MVITIDWFTYMLFNLLKEIGCPILIGVAVLWLFFRIRERNVNREDDE